MDKQTTNPIPRDAESLDVTEAFNRQLTHACTEFVIAHLKSLPDQPTWDLDGAAQLASQFVEALPERANSIDELLPRIDAAAQKTFNTAGPGYLAFIPGGGIYPAALADYIACSINRYVGVWNPAPALVQIELTAIDWIRQFIQLPPVGNGLLTSGGSISNLIAIVTARRTRLPENFFDAVIYTSRQAHHCVAKAALIAGFPESNVRYVDTDQRLRMRVDALQQCIESDLRQGLRPFLVVSNAGTTNTGAIDPTADIAELCDRYDMWLHVDAAYGGFFRAIEGGKELLPGLERADSVVLDPHKGLFLPYGTGCLLVRDGEALHKAHQLSADYMQDLEQPAGAVNFSDLSPELSRDFRGLRVWLPFKLFGAEAFRDNLREKYELAQWAYQELVNSPGFECLDVPQLSVVPFRYRPERGDMNQFNRKLLARVNDKGRVFLTSTLIDGDFVLRIAVLSFRTHSQHLVHAIEDIRAAAHEIANE